MPFYQWDGTKLTAGSVYQWDGTNLLPGVVRQYPWTNIGPGPSNPPLDGGTYSTVNYASSVDGGTPAQSGVLTDLVAAMPSPHYIAHRLGSQEAPQSTYYAANRLFSLYPSDPLYVGGECDLQALNDGTIVLHHDATIVFGGNTVNVNSLTPAQWDTVTIASPIAGQAAQPAAFWDHPSYPTKSVAARWGTSRVFVPEIKDETITTDLIDWITTNNAKGNIIVQSRNLSICQTLAAADVYALHLTFAVAPTTAQMDTYVSYGLLGFILSTAAIDATVVSNAHSRNLRVYGYNSNTAALMQGQIDLGVDGNLSDKPQLTFPAPFPPISTFTTSFDGGAP